MALTNCADGTALTVSNHPYTIATTANSADFSSVSCSNYYWYNPIQGLAFKYITYDITPISPNYLMDTTLGAVVQEARNLVLDEKEKTLREAGFKNKCGTWTDEALRIFLETKMDEDANKTALVDLAKKINEDRKAKKSCK